MRQVSVLLYLLYSYACSKAQLCVEAQLVSVQNVILCTNRKVFARLISVSALMLILCVIHTLQVLYHRGWYSAVDVASSSLSCSLLTRHPDNADLYLINLDPQIIQLLQEAKQMQKMNLEVHDAALALCQQEPHITSIRDSCVVFMLKIFIGHFILLTYTPWSKNVHIFVQL